MMEAYPYITPETLHLDYSLSPETIIVLPEDAQQRLNPILERYGRTLEDWNSERTYYVRMRRNFPFATIYFDQEYQLGGYITSKRWDKYDSPYQGYSYPPNDKLSSAGCWWFRTKDTLKYTAERCRIASRAWDLLKDKSENSPWVVFCDPLEPDILESAAKLNGQLSKIRKRNADLETSFPFNGEELSGLPDEFMKNELYGSQIWYTNPFAYKKLLNIMSQYDMDVEFLIAFFSKMYNKKHIGPWMTVCLNREYDLAAYLFLDCRLRGDEVNALTYTVDYHLTPEEFCSHYPFGIFYFAKKSDMRLCAGKSSMINRWWEQVKEFPDDRGWMLIPPEDLSEFEDTDIFACTWNT